MTRLSCTAARLQEVQLPAGFEQVVCARVACSARRLPVPVVPDLSSLLLDFDETRTSTTTSVGVNSSHSGASKSSDPEAAAELPPLGLGGLADAGRSSATQRDQRCALQALTEFLGACCSGLLQPPRHAWLTRRARGYDCIQRVAWTGAASKLHARRCFQACVQLANVGGAPWACLVVLGHRCRLLVLATPAHRLLLLSCLNVQMI